LNKTPTNELSYKLSKDNIAQERYKNPEDSRLLIADTKEIIQFKDLISVTSEKAVFVLNKSTVRNVRLKTNKIDSGGKLEIFILNIISDYECECLLKFSGKKTKGLEITTNIVKFKIIEKNNDTYKISTDIKVDTLIENYGITPLPPYIEDNVRKYEYYKTDFSSGGFSVAASTAGLHFNNKMISKLEKQNKIIKYINLDIGIGTFKPIDTNFIEDHKVHNENYFIKKNDYKEILKLKEDGYKIYSVGTTVLRTLETVINTKNYKGSTDLYIKPGYQFKLVDYLITNFHAPK
jgi:S-adenosylmethionine:tRNA-ribosyltransferase-isomerase (queuine synthetase)